MLLEHRVLLVLELREPCCLRYLLELELGLEEPQALELGLQQVLVQVLEQVLELVLYLNLAQALHLSKNFAD